MVFLHSQCIVLNRNGSAWRMIVACLIAIGIGFFWMLGMKKTILPFCSCLSIGVWIAYLKGYTILISFADLLG